MIIQTLDPLERTYRFAFYGRAASGKTSLLAALAMPRAPHPWEWGCTWLPGVFPPAGNPEDWDGDDRAVQFLRGREWLEGAIERLRSGQVPPPNPMRNILRFAYEFATPTRRPYRVELIDYSGELVDPKMTNDELASRLAEHLRHMNAVFVLAEMPAPRAVGTLPEELLKLQQAFALLASNRADAAAPTGLVGLLINKWDRRGRLNDGHADEGAAAVCAFLDEDTGASHRALAHTLSNAVGSENFHAFAVSAFGDHVAIEDADDGRTEIPREINPLNPFGLLDPLDWAAGRCDELALAAHRAASFRLNPWAFWQTRAGRGANVYQQRGRLLADRFPADSEFHATALQTNRRYSRILRGHLGLIAAIVFISLLTMQWTWDSFRFRRARAQLEDPQTNAAASTDAERWMAAYAATPALWHPLASLSGLSRGAAETLLTHYRLGSEDRAWRIVEQAPGGEVQARKAEEYLMSFARGKHVPEASDLVARAEHARDQQADLDMITQMESDFAHALPTPTEIQLTDLSTRLNQPPFPRSMDEDFVKRRDALRGKVEAAQARLQNLSFQRRYDDLITARDILGAARLLVQADPKRPDLTEDFRKKAISAITAEINGNLESRQWTSARDYYNNIHQSADVEQLLEAEEIRAMDDLAVLIDTTEDRSRYDEVVKYRDPDHVIRYRDDAPLKTMQSEVARYKQYLDTMAGPQELTLEIAQIDWGAQWSGYKNDILVTIDGKKIIDKTDVLGIANGTSSQVATGKFTATWTKSMKVNVKFTRQEWWWGQGTEDAGAAQLDSSPEMLVGQRIQLRSDKQNNAVFFSISGEPPEPPLPAWRGS
jgi:hypothetical protein